ncbi:MAG: Hsp20/alpha crystallin family protein [Magnetococcales bacterium]|nr:Hsp20/alpha crystallin family protein [Magnetococcales bacterium]
MFHLSRGSLAGCAAGLANPALHVMSCSSGMSWPSRYWSVKTDVSESADQLVFNADVPGMNPEDLKVTIEPGRLTIRGRRDYFHRDNHPSRCMGWASGFFLRTFQLPDGLLVEKARASTRNGVLTVSIPKSENTRCRRIDINASYDLNPKHLVSPVVEWRNKTSHFWNMTRNRMSTLFNTWSARLRNSNKKS